ncbi:hypothetical protein C8R44DRAFT_564983, partial [Mycena epipterygia]
AILHKSSGHFIYPSTIIKFIDDTKCRPTERLAAIENVSGVDSPFADLDRLYTEILSSCPARSRLLTILSVVMAFKLSPRHIEQLLELQPGDVRLVLRDLHSVLYIPAEDGMASDPIAVHHMSFRDFLDDPTRSGAFY